MSLNFFDGFDGQSVTKWTANATANYSATNPRNGTHCLDYSNSSVGTPPYRSLPLHATCIAGFAIRHTTDVSMDGSTQRGISLVADNNTTIHITLTILADGSIRVRRGAGNGTILGTSASVLTVGVYGYVELKVVMHDTTGTVDVRHNGVSVLSLTGQDTKNGGTEAGFSGFRVEGTDNRKVDDLYLCDGVDATATQKVANNDFLGDCVSTWLPPNADSTPSDWTVSTGSTSFDLLDEAPPNTTDYISSSTNAQVDRVAITNMADTTHVVFGLQTSFVALKESAGARSVRSGVFSNATLVNNPDKAVSTGYVDYGDIVGADPDGDIRWTPTKINAAFLQVEVRP